MTLVRFTADKILKWIEQHSPTFLPSAKDLAKEFNVGETTMTRAIRVLASRGIVRTSKGRRTEVLGAAGASNPAQQAEKELGPTGAQLFFDLRHDITTGSRKIGETLPKVEYLVTTRHVSRRVVVSVFRTLAGEDLAHKTGNRWVVGPQDAPRRFAPVRSAILSDHAPTLIVLTPTFEGWNQVVEGHRLSTFPFTLNEELVRSRARMLLCGVNPIQQTALCKAGPENVAPIIRELGDRFIGAVLPAGPFPLQLDPCRSEWYKLFASTRKPLIWANMSDALRDFDRNDFPEGLRFYQLVIDHQRETNTILDVLAQRGHRKVGVPWTAGVPGNWSRNRARRFESAAVRHPSHISVSSAEMRGDVWIREWSWNSPEWTQPHRLADELSRRITGEEPPFSQAPLRSAIMDAVPSIVKLINEDRVTAIVAPNDMHACQMYMILRMLDIRIPEDISLVSFDNSVFIRNYPIATLDRGFGHMAYCTVRIAVGDIPIQANRRGMVSSECVLIDRGSLARPRRNAVRV